MAGLEIDEVEAGIVSIRGGMNEVVGERIQLVVGDERLLRRRTHRGVHVRVASHGHWCRDPGRCGVAHAAGVCELQSDDKVSDLAVNAFVLLDR